MPPTYTNAPRAVQSVSVPTAQFDGPSVEDLRARRVRSRLRFSPEVAAQVAALAYAVPENLRGAR